MEQTRSACRDSSREWLLKQWLLRDSWGEGNALHPGWSVVTQVQSQAAVCKLHLRQVCFWSKENSTGVKVWRTGCCVLGVVFFEGSLQISDFVCLGGCSWSWWGAGVHDSLGVRVTQRVGSGHWGPGSAPRESAHRVLGLGPRHGLFLKPPPGDSNVESRLWTTCLDFCSESWRKIVCKVQVLCFLVASWVTPLTVPLAVGTGQSSVMKCPVRKPHRTPWK